MIAAAASGVATRKRERLLEVEVHGVGVVVVVADGEVLPGLEQEVAAALAEHDRAVDARATTTIGPPRILRRWSNSG